MACPVALPVTLTQQIGNGHIRYIPDPMRASVIDVIKLATGQNNHLSAQSYRRLCETYPEILTHTTDYKFPGQGQRKTPIAGVEGIVNVLQVLPGPKAAAFRKEQGELTVRFLGGDEDLIRQIKHINETTTEETNWFKEYVSRKRKYAACEGVTGNYLDQYHKTNGQMVDIGVSNRSVFAYCESLITETATGKKPWQVKEERGGRKSQSARQLMTDEELWLVQGCKLYQADFLQDTGNPDGDAMRAAQTACKKMANVRQVLIH